AEGGTPVCAACAFGIAIEGHGEELDRVVAQGPGRNGPAAGRDPLALEPSRTIGPYSLLESLGEGGMGQVWLAEQAEPVRRRVALKLIKPGMDSRQVLARFDAEREALARMEHPGIAHILDAGATEEGRPYVVMEHVDGIPIIAYCDRHR